MTFQSRPGATAVFAIFLAGCTFTARCNDDPPTVSKETLEQTTRTRLEQQNHRRLERLECAGPLEAKVGASVRCTLINNGIQIGLTSTITSVEGVHANWNIVFDKQAQRMLKATVEQRAGRMLEKIMETHPIDVTCPSDLETRPGQSLRCSFTMAGRRLGLSVRVDAVDGGDISYGVWPDDYPRHLVEERARTTLAPTVGDPIDAIECPEDLKYRDGASTRCVLTSGHRRYGLKATLSIAGDKAEINFLVDHNPM